MNIFIRIWAFITRGRLVWLRNYDGNCTLSIARVTPFGDLIAKTQWPTNTKNIRLMSDGSAKGVISVVEWKYA